MRRRLRILVRILYVVRFRTFAFSHFAFYTYPLDGMVATVLLNFQTTLSSLSSQVITVPVLELALTTVVLQQRNLQHHQSNFLPFVVFQS